MLDSISKNTSLLEDTPNPDAKVIKWIYTTLYEMN